MKRQAEKISKGWGHELVWAEGPGYTGKTLHFDREGASFSLHYHLEKHETWLVTSGRFALDVIYTENARSGTLELDVGDVWVNTPGLPHRLTALAKGSEIIEVSTRDDPADNYRIKAGDSQR